MEVLKETDIFHRVNGELRTSTMGQYLTSRNCTSAEAVVCIYFSASWCNPCGIFTPTLKAVYADCEARGVPFSVIFASQDHTRAEYDTYFSSMPWAAFKFKEPKLRYLMNQYKVDGFPCAVLVDATGTVQSYNAAYDIQSGRSYPFYDPNALSKPEIQQIERPPFKLATDGAESEPLPAMTLSVGDFQGDTEGCQIVSWPDVFFVIHPTGQVRVYMDQVQESLFVPALENRKIVELIQMTFLLNKIHIIHNSQPPLVSYLACLSFNATGMEQGVFAFQRNPHMYVEYISIAQNQMKCVDSLVPVNHFEFLIHSNQHTLGVHTLRITRNTGIVSLDDILLQLQEEKSTHIYDLELPVLSTYILPRPFYQCEIVCSFPEQYDYSIPLQCYPVSIAYSSKRNGKRQKVVCSGDICRIDMSLEEPVFCTSREQAEAYRETEGIGNVVSQHLRGEELSLDYCGVYVQSKSGQCIVMEKKQNHKGIADLVHIANIVLPTPMLSMCPVPMGLQVAVDSHVVLLDCIGRSHVVFNTPLTAIQCYITPYTSKTQHAECKIQGVSGNMVYTSNLPAFLFTSHNQNTKQYIQELQIPPRISQEQPYIPFKTTKVQHPTTITHTKAFAMYHQSTKTLDITLLTLCKDQFVRICSTDISKKITPQQLTLYQDQKNKQQV